MAASIFTIIGWAAVHARPAGAVAQPTCDSSGSGNATIANMSPVPAFNDGAPAGGGTVGPGTSLSFTRLDEAGFVAAVQGVVVPGYPTTDSKSIGMVSVGLGTVTGPFTSPPGKTAYSDETPLVGTFPVSPPYGSGSKSATSLSAVVPQLPAGAAPGYYAVTISLSDDDDQVPAPCTLQWVMHVSPNAAGHAQVDSEHAVGDAALRLAQQILNDYRRGGPMTTDRSLHSAFGITSVGINYLAPVEANEVRDREGRTVDTDHVGDYVLEATMGNDQLGNPDPSSVTNVNISEVDPNSPQYFYDLSIQQDGAVDWFVDPSFYTSDGVLHAPSSLYSTRADSPAFISAGAVHQVDGEAEGVIRDAQHHKPLRYGNFILPAPGS